MKVAFLHNLIENYKHPQLTNMSRAYARTTVDNWRKSNVNPQGTNPGTSQKASYNRPAVSPITEDDGFTTVSNGRAIAAFSSHNNQSNRDRVTSPLAPTSASRSNIIANKRSSHLGNSPPSIAASRRADVYELRHKTPSFRNSILGSVNGKPDLKSDRVQKLSKYLFKPGMIVRGICHEQDFHNAANGSTMTLADRYTTESKFGLIHSKYRKMIVVGLYDNHYLALPLYTHNGNGISRKAKPDEFVSVHDHRSLEPFTKQTRHSPLVTGEMNEGINPIDPQSCAHITHPMARKYDLPLVVEGYLNKESTGRLWDLFYRSLRTAAPE